MVRPPRLDRLTSRRSTFAAGAVHVVVLAALCFTFERHAVRLGHDGTVLAWAFFGAFLGLAAHAVLSLHNADRSPFVEGSRPDDGRHARHPATSADLDDRRVTVVIPVYNEDFDTLVACLRSLAAQTRLADRVHLVDDGSDDPSVADRAAATVRGQLGSELLVSHLPNSGKRRAQSIAFTADPDAWVFVTLDSDTVLHPDALRETAYAFADPGVTAVGGVLLGLNADRNLLTRLVDLGFTSSFLNGRAAWSTIGSVVVHCGGLASYRADVVRRYHRYYVDQTVFGQAVSSGDDRMLTTLALLHGRSVTQESAIGYTLLPENLSHLTRQRVRWWRSFFWGGLWLIRHMPMNRLAWWLVAYQFVSFTLFSVVGPTVFLVLPIAQHRVPWELFVYLGLLAYLRSVRYLTVRRPAERFGDRLLTYALAPLSAGLHLYLCSGLQYVGLATVRTVGWGTRRRVEVGLQP